MEESLAVGGAASPPRRDRWDYFLILAIFAGIGVLAYAALATPLLQPLVDVARREHWSMLWVRPTIIWISMGLALLLLRTVLWLLYRPFEALLEEDAPPLTVLIPAYREAEMIPFLLESLEALDYPKDKLDVKLLLEEDRREHGDTKPAKSAIHELAARRPK